MHIGVGGFHRSHQAMYIDTLMNRGAAMDWGICGIGVQPSNTTMRDALAAQDGLYTLVLQAQRRHLGAPRDRVDRGVPARARRSRRP